MSISAEVPGQSPAAVLADAIASVRGLAETLWSACSDEELVETVGLVQQLVAAAAVVEAGAVVEVDARDLAKEKLHYGSTGDWLTHLGGLRHGEGKKRVKYAQALCGPLTRTREALLAGTVSPTQADVIVRSVADLPSADLVRRRGEKVLVRQAGHLNASELAKAGRHVAEVVDPDAVDRRLEAQLEREERAAHLDRYLSITDDRAGGVRIRGRGSAEDGALIKAALLPLTCPDPTSRSRDRRVGRDPRDHGARMWDALVATAQHALNTGLPPDTHGTPARLLVTVDHAMLTTGTTADGTDLTARRPPPPGLRRRDHPRRPRNTRRGPRRRPAPPPGHPRDLDRSRRTRPALHLPRLHQTTTRCATPTTCGTGSTAETRPWIISRCCADTITGSSTTRPGRYDSTPTTDNPNSCHHRNSA